MSQITKTEAVVLSKLNYGDTSSIAALYSRDYGQFSVIVKGARKSKSGTGFMVDPLNYLQIVFYKKESRELQLLSSASLIAHYPGIKNDLEKLQYAQAILELMKKLTVENETNEKLFRGLVRILELFDSSTEKPVVLFGKFFLFFLKELGYELQIDKCSSCGRTDISNAVLSYNYEMGILCSDCRHNYVESYTLKRELFQYLSCLKFNKSNIQVESKIAEESIVFMDRYLKYHVPDFKGLQSLRLFNFY